jgi:hypothetical protein
MPEKTRNKMTHEEKVRSLGELKVRAEEVHADSTACIEGAQSETTVTLKGDQVTLTALASGMNAVGDQLEDVITAMGDMRQELEAEIRGKRTHPSSIEESLALCILGAIQGGASLEVRCSLVTSLDQLMRSTMAEKLRADRLARRSAPTAKAIVEAAKRARGEDQS